MNGPPARIREPSAQLEQSEFEAFDELCHEDKNQEHRVKNWVGRDLILMYGPAARSQGAFVDEEIGSMRKADAGGS
jgi:hypothetical protein